MLLLKVRTKLLYSKKNVLDIILLNYLVESSNRYKNKRTNHFVSLKSPFHYKLSKNHLHIKHITVDYYVLSLDNVFPSTPIFGLVSKHTSFSKVKYNL